jgi:hypothetical protein
VPDIKTAIRRGGVGLTLMGKTEPPGQGRRCLLRISEIDEISMLESSLHFITPRQFEDIR